LKQPPIEIIQEETNSAKKIIDQKVETIVTSKSDEIQATIKPVLEEIKTEPESTAPTSKPIITTTTSLEGKIDYTKLRSSITKIIEQDTQIINEAIFNDCETIKKKTGALDCVSNIERLGYQKNDPYNLSTIFKALDKNPDNKMKERALAKLKLNERYINKVLDNKELPSTMREQFKEEIAYIRGEIHYQDCDGKPNSGNCAGEVDLIKVYELLSLLFVN
jgi:hypothetical protein